MAILLLRKERKERLLMYKIKDEKEKKSAESYDSLNDSQDFTRDFGESKICSAYNSGESVDWKSIKSRIKNPEYVCSSCGRSASDSSSLCSPELL